MSKPETAARSAANTPALTACRLLRTAWKATLATLDSATGAPYGSLVAVAAAPDGTPLLLLSGLALHTKNLAADPRASLLVDGTSSGPQALTGSRVTVVGRLTQLPNRLADPAIARQRYLARHPSAAMFVDFADFQFYALDIEWGHLVAGFGRIDRLQRSDLIQPVDDADAVVAAECDIVQHMNEDHADAIRLMAVELASAADGAWRMLGCDPTGIDLACADGTDVDAAVRLDFPQRIKTPEAARTALIGLVAQARLARASQQRAD